MERQEKVNCIAGLTTLLNSIPGETFQTEVPGFANELKSFVNQLHGCGIAEVDSLLIDVMKSVLKKEEIVISDTVDFEIINLPAESKAIRYRGEPLGEIRRQLRKIYTADGLKLELTFFFKPCHNL